MDIDSSVVRYRLDARRSRFTVRAFAGGLLSALGHSPTIAIRDFDGIADINYEDLESASVRLWINAESLTVIDDVGDKDRQEMERQMREDVLETTKYPQILYESISVSSNKIFEGQYRFDIAGKLSLHGKTRDYPITAQVNASEDRLKATGGFSLRQTDFGIKRVAAAGGTIKLKDELKFSFDISANREKGES